MVASLQYRASLWMKLHSRIIVVRFTLSRFIADGRELLHSHIMVARFILVTKKWNYKGN